MFGFTSSLNEPTASTIQLRSANLAARRALEIRAMCQGEVMTRGCGFWPIFGGGLFLENQLKLHLLGSEEPLVLGKMKEMVQGVLCLWYPK